MSIYPGLSGIVIDGREVPWLGGTIHYWRLEREEWDHILDAAAGFGLSFIETYIPWSVHEIERGRFDFGQSDPKKDVGTFIDMIGERGLYVMVRPGPHINAELTGFGYPERIFAREEMLSRSALGSLIWLPVLPKAFPCPSYADNKFLNEFGLYLDALAPVLVPRLYPQGPVVACQVDNEMSYFFRTAIYDHDYSKSAAAMWSVFLQERYGALENLGRAYGKNFSSFESVPMPVRFEAQELADFRYYLDFAEFKEELMVRPLAELKNMLVDRGIDRILFFHNYPMTRGKTPFSYPKTEAVVDVSGVDSYHRKKNYVSIKKMSLSVAAQSRLPVIPEFGAGCYLFWPPLDLDDHKFAAMTALMHGIKGINFYMLVERERWYGSPIDRHGHIRTEHADFIKKLVSTLNEHRFFSMKREAKISFVSARVYDRLEKASYLFSPITPIAFEFSVGPEYLCHEGRFGQNFRPQIDHHRFLEAGILCADRHAIPYVLADSDQNVPFASSVIACPTFDWLDIAAQKKLMEHAEAGGIAIIGPEMPCLDEHFEEQSLFEGRLVSPEMLIHKNPDALLFSVGKGKVLLVLGIPDSEEIADSLWSSIFQALNIDSVFLASSPCETSLFQADDGRRIVFVANPSETSQLAFLKPGFHCRLSDLFTGEEFFGTPDAFPIMMPAFTVRMLKAEL